ncbi:hypothetical protein VTK56DRAFT_8296 [Thermocarpiscus australiensis]
MSGPLILATNTRGAPLLAHWNWSFQSQRTSSHTFVSFPQSPLSDCARCTSCLVLARFDRLIPYRPFGEAGDAGVDPETATATRAVAARCSCSEQPSRTWKLARTIASGLLPSVCRHIL